MRPNYEEMQETLEFLGAIIIGLGIIMGVGAGAEFILEYIANAWNI